MTARAIAGHAPAIEHDDNSGVQSGISALVRGLQAALRLPDDGREMAALHEAGRTLDSALAAATSQEAAVMFRNMATIASITGSLAREYEQASIDHLVRAIMPGPAIAAADIKRRLMVAKARTAVMESGDWVSAAQIAELAGFSTKNVGAQPNKWKKAGDIFAITANGQDYFPLYGLDPNTHRPLKAMKNVIATFAGAKDGWGLAYWFATVNGYLGGARPQDVLDSDTEVVLSAARAEMSMVAHG